MQGPLVKQEQSVAGSLCRSGSAMLNKNVKPNTRLIGQLMLKRVILSPNISVRQNKPSSRCRLEKLKRHRWWPVLQEEQRVIVVFK